MVGPACNSLDRTTPGPCHWIKPLQRIGVHDVVAVSMKLQTDNLAYTVEYQHQTEEWAETISAYHEKVFSKQEVELWTRFILALSHFSRRLHNTFGYFTASSDSKKPHFSNRRKRKKHVFNLDFTMRTKTPNIKKRAKHQDEKGNQLP